MPSEITWEKIWEIPASGLGTHAATYKAKVPGGWLYRHATFHTGVAGDSPFVTESMVFVPGHESKTSGNTERTKG